MFVGRIALGTVVSLMLCIGARAQTQMVTFQDAEARGALWEATSTLAGCSVLAPRDGGGQVSAFVDIDCREFTAPTRPGGAITVRLFSRMVLAQPWVVQSVVASYQPSIGAGATVRIVRPAAGTTGSTRNAWVEFNVLPEGSTAGSVSVTLTAAVPNAVLSSPFSLSCGRQGLPAIACNVDADCANAYRCATECGNICIRR